VEDIFVVISILTIQNIIMIYSYLCN